MILPYKIFYVRKGETNDELLPLSFRNESTALKYAKRILIQAPWVEKCYVAKADKDGFSKYLVKRKDA